MEFSSQSKQHVSARLSHLCQHQLQQPAQHIFRYIQPERMCPFSLKRAFVYNVSNNRQVHILSQLLHLWALGVIILRCFLRCNSLMEDVLQKNMKHMGNHIGKIPCILAVLATSGEFQILETEKSQLHGSRAMLVIMCNVIIVYLILSHRKIVFRDQTPKTSRNPR